VPLGDVMRGIGIGVVEESRHATWNVGDAVIGSLGWQRYYTGSGKALRKLPDLPIPMEAHFGLLGHIGLTAYFGLVDIGQPKPGETLVVSAAAGAVGSLAGQMGKIKGCRVVGIAGSQEKCRWITESLGFDAAINYRTEDVADALRRHCPDGIDIYFENVGGKILEAVLDRMNNFGRIPACGMISGYAAASPQPGPSNLFQIVVKRIRMQGFIVMDLLHREPEAVPEILQWYASGRLRYRLHVFEGLESAPEALRALFEGSNHGKVLVQVS
jgi:NADPH-dependent curcumin reductase CurA